MKSLWVLSVKTSLPNVCELASDMKTEFYAFESFDDAKKSLEKKLKELAFSKNAMFDGEGNMIYFKKYLDVTISSSSTIIFPYLLTMLVTPSMIFLASPQFSSRSIIVIFLKPLIECT